MFSPQQTSTAMELLPLLCLLLTCSAGTSADQNGPVIVKEESDAILPCSLSTKKDIESELFDWKKKGQKNKDVFLYNDKAFYGKGLSGQDEQFKGRVSHFPDELKYGNASIIIRNTKVTDSGDYTCEFPDLQQSPVLIELVVDHILKDRSAENIPGAAAKPSVTTLDETKDWELLQCEVLGAFPKPTVEWQDSAGNKLPAEEPQVSERGGSYDITLNTTVTKTDRYRCVATQEEIKHQIYAEIYVLINGAAAEPSVRILDQTNDGMLLQCEVRGAFPKPTVEWRDSAGKMVPAEEPQVSERGGSFYITLQTTVMKTDNYRCVATQEEIKHQMYAETYVPFNGSPKQSSIGWIVVLLVLLVLNGHITQN
ncbi:butyrophilin-like protein 1 isoform X2 [Micropterus dolomieu]|uniref:butyrophilin-like protein 1 isoform X2 n=1 Tax=Micropterus dolomieu TaxID=147949 RepID=UPI001E8E0AD0|nr:butyrophilin-like protein 1 isoform X2 [Micropterus dolomieu]